MRSAIIWIVVTVLSLVLVVGTILSINAIRNHPEYLGIAVFMALFLIGGLVVLMLNSLVQIPTAHYGLVVMFGERTGRVLDEGLHFLLPLIENVLLVSYELKTMEIDVENSGTENSGTDYDLISLHQPLLYQI
jgi:regulator of protease activity HflC (stomatin/prohibitin superfamily)